MPFMPQIATIISLTSTNQGSVMNFLIKSILVLLMTLSLNIMAEPAWTSDMPNFYSTSHIVLGEKLPEGLNTAGNDKCRYNQGALCRHLSSTNLHFRGFYVDIIYSKDTEIVNKVVFYTTYYNAGEFTSRNKSFIKLFTVQGDIQPDDWKYGSVDFKSKDGKVFINLDAKESGDHGERGYVKATFTQLQ